MVDDQLPASLEQIKQGRLATRSIEDVLLVDLHDRQSAPLGCQRVPCLGCFLLLAEQLFVSALPLGRGNDLQRHQVTAPRLLIGMSETVVGKSNYNIDYPELSLDSPRMAVKRTYGDPCGVARALDLVGERWALLVVRELVLGPKRFTDLRTALPHLSPDVLSQRLRELELVGIVRRRKLPPPAGSRVYELTDRGRELEPVVLALGRWGSRAPFPPTDAELSIDSLVLALKTLFEPSAADGLDADCELRLGEDRFHAHVGDDRLELARGTADQPDAIIETDPGTLARVLWHGHPLTEALRSGEVRIEGDRRAAKRLLSLFPAPQPAAVAGSSA